jgi:hypothetical protein
MGLIREALRAPRFDGDEAEAEAAIVRLVDGSAIGVGVPYDLLSGLVFGHRPLTGPPKGVRFDEKRGWLALNPPACAAEDEGVFPLTAIVAIMPVYPDDIEEIERQAAEDDHAAGPDDEHYASSDSNGNGYVEDTSDDPRPR